MCGSMLKVAQSNQSSAKPDYKFRESRLFMLKYRASALQEIASLWENDPCFPVVKYRPHAGVAKW